MKTALTVNLEQFQFQIYFADVAELSFFDFPYARLDILSVSICFHTMNSVLGNAITLKRLSTCVNGLLCGSNGVLSFILNIRQKGEVASTSPFPINFPFPAYLSMF